VLDIVVPELLLCEGGGVVVCVIVLELQQSLSCYCVRGVALLCEMICSRELITALWVEYRVRDTNECVVFLCWTYRPELL